MAQREKTSSPGFPLPRHFRYRLDLSRHVTPRLIKGQPVHNWFYFPHSFSPQLVELLLDEWNILPGSLVLDPFVGAGTTLCVARSKGINSLGLDISPLSVFISNTKIQSYDAESICEALQEVENDLLSEEDVDVSRVDRLTRAFTDGEFRILRRLQLTVLRQPDPIQNLLLLGLLRVQQQFSRAVPDGGWFRWVERSPAKEDIWPCFQSTIESMVEDLEHWPDTEASAIALCHDARRLNELQQTRPELSDGCHAIITSPPYPNRHDYSRIFQIELLTLGLDESDIFSLRYNSLRSHVEARKPDCPLPSFEMPRPLREALSWFPKDADRRLRPMIEGYFEDMNAVLRSAYDLLVPGGHIALVVGNVRHAGVLFPVDEILLSLGLALGFEPVTSLVARLRGNSAQQMGMYGRMPARESIVIMQKPR